MKTFINKITLALIAGALLLPSSAVIAQEKKDDKAAEKKTEGKGDEKKAPNPNRALPLRGKVESVNAAAKTVTVGTRTFHVTDKTRIAKDGVPGKFEDIKAGEPIRGSLRQTEDGKLTAQTINLGQKPADGEKQTEQKPGAEKPVDGKKPNKGGKAVQKADPVAE